MTHYRHSPDFNTHSMWLLLAKIHDDVVIIKNCLICQQDNGTNQKIVSLFEPIYITEYVGELSHGLHRESTEGILIRFKHCGCGFVFQISNIIPTSKKYPIEKMYYSSKT